MSNVGGKSVYEACEENDSSLKMAATLRSLRPRLTVPSNWTYPDFETNNVPVYRSQLKTLIHDQFPTSIKIKSVLHEVTSEIVQYYNIR